MPRISGWIFDAYPLTSGMSLWILDEQGRMHALRDPWQDRPEHVRVRQTVDRLPKRGAERRPDRHHDVVRLVFYSGNMAFPNRRRPSTATDVSRVFDTPSSRSAKRRRRYDCSPSRRSAVCRSGPREQTRG